MDFENAKRYILNRLENELSSDLYYHGVHHTIDVYEVVIKIAELENLTQEEKQLVTTAALYHDAGFLFQYANNEQLAANLVQQVLPSFDYNKKQIEIISSIILSTQLKVRPSSLLQKIMSDADYDYLGREDNFKIAQNLYKELLDKGFSFSDEAWNNLQIKFLKQHEYYTTSSTTLRNPKKKAYLNSLERKQF